MLALVLILIGGLSIPIRSATLKARVIELLTEELESEVTIDTLEGHVFPRVSVSGRGVDTAQRAHGRAADHRDRSVRNPRVAGDLMKEPRRVRKSVCTGCGCRFHRVMMTIDEPAKPGSPMHKSVRAPNLQQVVIDRFEAPDTVITLIPKKAGKQPKVFTVHHLVMDSLGVNQTIPYIATLTNPVPKGEIETSGTFGPWNVAHPARTPVTGKYTFANANLDTIEGLAGVSARRESFDGPLNRIEVQGTTDTPKFQVDAGGLPVPLKTRFTAIVDGSDGDTYLNQVDATFLDTSLTAHGAVIGFEGVKGRQIEVDVTMKKGRIEDLLRLAVESETPILVGAAQLQAKLVIPPEQEEGDRQAPAARGVRAVAGDVHRCRVQTKLVGLSRRGQGMTEDEDG